MGNNVTPSGVMSSVLSFDSRNTESVNTHTHTHSRTHARKKKHPTSEKRLNLYVASKLAFQKGSSWRHPIYLHTDVKSVFVYIWGFFLYYLLFLNKHLLVLAVVSVYSFKPNPSSATLWFAFQYSCFSYFLTFISWKMPMGRGVATATTPPHNRIRLRLISWLDRILSSGFELGMKATPLYIA